MKSESHKSKSLIEKALYKFAPNLMLHRKPEAFPLTINWRRVFILPTKPGLFFGLVTFLMLIASLNFNNNMGLMMTFLLVGLAQVALYRVFFNLKNLTLENITAKPVFLGQKATFTIQLKSVESKFDIKINQNTLEFLPAEKLKSLPYSLPTKQRGWLILGKLKVSTSYPFGLFFAWIWTNSDHKCLVYPMPENSPPPLPTHAQHEGETTVIKQGDDFHGLKPFQAGDSMRMIAWKRTAQTGELISREFQHTKGKKLLLDYSQVPLSSREEKLSRLTAWVLMAYQQQLDYCLKLPHFNSDFGSSSKHHVLCLKKLALYGIES